MAITELLRAHGLAPKKRFGQNFLVDPNAARIIAEAATTPIGGTVVEIGPGLGALTKLLVARAARVVAIERDRELVPILAEQLGGAPVAVGAAAAAAIAGLPTGDERALLIIEADALDVDWAAPFAGGPRPHVVAGNLPYSITGKLLERCVGLAARVDAAVFMVQAEVADRLVARADTEAYGALSVFVQAAFDVRRILSVKAGAFHPRPEVDSAVVRLVPHTPPRALETDAFRALVKGAFGARRKTLRNAWKGLFGWTREELAEHAAAAGVSLDARGETLDVEAFAAVAARAEHPAPTTPAPG